MCLKIYNLFELAMHGSYFWILEAAVRLFIMHHIVMLTFKFSRNEYNKMQLGEIHVVGILLG